MLIWEGKIYYFKTHIFYSSDQFWVNQLYRTEHETEAVTIVKNIQTFNICFNNRSTSSFYQSGIKSSSFNINRRSKLMAIILLMKRLSYTTSQLAAAAILWCHNSGAVRRAFSFPLLTPSESEELLPTVTALQTLLEVCHAYAGPHDFVYNTMKTVCMLVRPKQSQGRFSTRVRLGNEELSFVEEFCYLWHVMYADCRDDKDIEKTIQEAKFRWQYVGQEVLICTYWGKNPTVEVVLLPHLWMCTLLILDLY